MRKVFAAVALGALMAFPAFAQDAQPTGAAMTTGQISASDLLGETVMNEANESIGDVNDVILDRDGKVTSVIVGAGGFLGMGEKDVALSFDKLKFATDKDNDLVVTTNATKESLQALPTYKRDNR